MLSLPCVVRIYLHVEPVNLHLGFDRLANLVREDMGQDPLGGHVFVFRNRRGDRVKLLFWDDDGFAVLYTRLESGVFRFPPTDHGVASLQVKVSELSLFLDAESTRLGPRTRRGDLETFLVRVDDRGVLDMVDQRGNRDVFGFPRSADRVPLPEDCCSRRPNLMILLDITPRISA